MRDIMRTWVLVATGISSAVAIKLNLQDTASIKSAASTVAHGMMNYYHGNETGQTPGLLPQPYYWWEAGAMMGALIDYWYYTGDSTYNNNVMQALEFQESATFDYMPPNQTKTEGNDDQAFWAFAVLTAMEHKFPDPPPGSPQWFTLAAAVFNSQAFRWSTEQCGGGLHWQIFPLNNGYTYKNAPSNAAFINIGARLYAYSGNASYVEWITQGWDWMERVGLIAPDYLVYDGTSTPDNCTTLDHHQWTYTVGMLINTASIMWNMTNGSSIWHDRALGIWNASTPVFFTQDKIMFEMCETPPNKCDVDQFSFKSYFTRYLAASTKYLPSLLPLITPYIAASAAAAAAQCSGGSDGVTCGTTWNNTASPTTWDGSYGVGQQMSALQIIQANLISQVPGPVTNTTGGTSKGNASFGTGGTTDGAPPLAPVTTADRAGAGVLTAVVVLGTLVGGWWLVS